MNFVMKLTFEHRSSSGFMCSLCFFFGLTLLQLDERAIVRVCIFKFRVRFFFSPSLCDSNVIEKPTSGVLFLLVDLKRENKKFLAKSEMNVIPAGDIFYWNFSLVQEKRRAEIKFENLKGKDNRTVFD